MGSKQNVTVILVHGTFSLNPSYFDPKRSMLRRALPFLLQDVAEIQYETFQWTGRLFGLSKPKAFQAFNNSHTARLRGGERLKDRIREIKKEKPHEKIYIVAHSHGGNVSLYAWELLDPHERPDGIISLSTPFLRVCRSRETLGDKVFRRTLKLVIFSLWSLLALVLWFFTLVLVISNVEAKADAGFDPGISLFAIGLLLTYVSLPYVVLGIYNFANRKKSRIDKLSQQYDRLALPSVDETQHFVAGTAWDEAAFATTVGSTIYQAFNFGFSRVASPFVIAGGIIVGISLFKDVVPTTWTVSSVTWLVIFSLLFVVGAYFIIGLGRLVAGLVVRGFAYGPESPLVSTCLDIHISKTPPGIVRWRGYVPGNPGFLVHSKLYENKECIRDIGTWMRERLTVPSSAVVHDTRTAKVDFSL